MIRIGAIFGEAVTGIGYQFFSLTALLGARVTTGIDSPATGVYVADGVTVPGGAVGVLWDSGDGLARAEEVFDPRLENLDAAVSSRLATAGYTAPTVPPTAAQVRQEMDANSTKLANLNATVSSRSSHSAADVWVAATRSLTDKAGFSLAVAPPTAAEVWAHASRTLTDKSGFTLSGSLTTLDALNVSLSTVHGAGSWLAVSGFATPANVTDARDSILAALPSGFAVPGDVTAARDLILAALPSGYATTLQLTSARDSILSAFPDDYQRTGLPVTLPNPAPAGYGVEGLEISGLTDEQAAQLQVIYTRSAAAAVYVLPVSEDGGTIYLDRWNDYAGEDGRRLSFTSGGWPSLIGATVVLKIGAALSIDGAVDDLASVSFEISKEETGRLSGETSFEIEALIEGRRVTLSRGKVVANNTLQND